MQGVKRHQVKLLPHDSAWDIEFEGAKAKIERIWHANVLDIQHIGSTAIRHIWAKPILDIAITLKSLENMDTDAMVHAGYDYRGPQNPEGSRHLFVLRSADELSLQHLHCYEPNDENLRQCLLFRDYLNENPAEAQRYSDLKRELAKQYPHDRVTYSAKKDPFIQSILMKAIEQTDL